MPFEVRPGDEPVAFLFPGQGAHGERMLDPVRDAPGLPRYYDLVCRLLGRDPLADAARDPSVLHRNAESSLLTVLASVASLELLRAASPQCRPVAVAGYSVGQWTALYAAGAFDVEELFAIVARRARMMDACVATAEPGGMIAVVGVARANLVALCADAAALGYLLEIANENAPLHMTLGGSDLALRWAEARLAAWRPKRLLRLTVSGAWHTSQLARVVPELAAALATLPVRALEIPVIDNTTGGWLPDDATARCEALARQVASPVLWRQGITTLAAAGVRCCAEIGYGDLLTNYGFFVDRSLRHVAAAPLARPRS